MVIKSAKKILLSGKAISFSEGFGENLTGVNVVSANHVN
jgi:hypothetical protein